MNTDLLLFKDKHDEILEKIFSSDDIRDIRLTRKKFEEDKNKTNDKEVFLSYIKYEIFLWKTVISKTRNVNDHRSFANMIINLHKVALKYHKEDLPLWLSFLKFCMEADFTNLLSDIFVQILCYHTDEHLWLLAAKWELDEHNNIERALAYLNRCIFYHPGSSAGYCELFRLELLENTEHTERNTLKLFDSIENKLPKNVDLYINLFRISGKYVKIQNEICEKMLLHFQKEEKLWEILANRELEGHHLSKDLKYNFIPDHLYELRIRNHIKKYKYSITNLIKTESLWTKYLNSLLNIQEDVRYNKYIWFLKKTFLEDCMQAHKDKLLSEDIYLKWIEYLDNNNEKDFMEILREATIQKPKCLQLWVARIRSHMKCKSDPDTIEDIFNEAIEMLGENCTQMWRLKIQYYQLNLSSERPKVENVYRAALGHSPGVARNIRPQFLDWLVLFKSNEAAYEEYNKSVNEEPFCLELHKKMTELEAMRPRPNKEILEHVSKVAIEQFGKNTWHEYIHEEISCGPRWKRDVFRKYLLNI